MGQINGGEESTRPRFSTDGKHIAVWVRLDTKVEFLVQDHEGMPVTIRWTVRDLCEAVSARTNINTPLQVLWRHQKGEPDQTIEELAGALISDEETEIMFDLLTERGKFPESLPPMHSIAMPAKWPQFQLPADLVGQELNTCGCKLRLPARALNEFGFSAGNEEYVTWQTSPLVRAETLRGVWPLADDAEGYLHLYPSDVEDLEKVFLERPLPRNEREAVASLLLIGGHVLLQRGQIVGMGTMKINGECSTADTVFDYPRPWKMSWTKELVRKGRCFQKTPSALRALGALWFLVLLPGEFLSGECLDAPYGGVAFFFHKELLNDEEDELDDEEAKFAFDRYFTLRECPCF